MDLKDIHEMTVDEFMEYFNRCEVVTKEFENCRSMYEKLIMLCMVLDTIACTEDITQDELYEAIDDLKPIIERVNEIFEKGDVINENNDGDM